jgi:orotate phosphoribosyltransferase
MKRELIDMLCRKSFQYSQEPVFKLVSGRMSHFYVNCKPSTLNPRGMYLVGHLLFDRLRDAGVAAVGGLTFGADPVAFAAAFASELHGKPIKAFSIRKTQKDHGIVRWLEGDLQKGERVAIVDDVATTGGSTITAIERAAAEGLVVVKAVVLVDRQEGGLDNIRRLVADVSGIITRDELLQRWHQIRKEGGTRTEC